jgi:hypothetical protein
MIRLTKALSAWGNANFNEILKQDIEQMNADQLPLQQGLTTGSYVGDGNRTVMIISVVEAPAVIRVKAGIFYTGVIAGCNCADDPTPVNEHSEYCEVQIDINRMTAEATITLLPD